MSSVLGDGTRHSAQGTRHRAQGRGQRAEGRGYIAQGTGHRVQGTGYRVQGTGYMAQGAGHMAICHMAHGVCGMGVVCGTHSLLKRESMHKCQQNGISTGRWITGRRPFNRRARTFVAVFE